MAVKRYKILKIILALFLLSSAGIYSYFEFGAYFSFDKSDRQKAVESIKAAPNLPDRFVEIYTSVNPDWDNSLKISLIATLFGNEVNECACKNAVTDYHFIPRYKSIYEAAQLILYLERNVTSRECLSYTMNVTDFGFATHNIWEASRHYYGKELEDLNDDETLELIVMSKNTYFYDKKRFPDRLTNRIEQLKGEL